MKTEVKFSIIVTAIFMVLELIVISHHEMWRDEIQHFLIARNSLTISALFQGQLLDVHPAIWPLMMYALSHFTNSLWSIQLLHWAIAGSIVYIFSRYSPFTKAQKVLFPFGYMIFFEYATISRNYSIGILFIFILCCIFKERYNGFLTTSIVLFLIANANILGLIIAAAVGFSLAMECLLEWEEIHMRVSRNRLVLGFYIIFVGCVASGAQCITSCEQLGPSTMRLPTSLDARFLEGIVSLPIGIFPILPIKLHFWEYYVLGAFGLSHLELITAITVGLIVYTSLLLLAKRTVLCIYLLSTLGIIYFFYTVNSGFLRHYGYHYVLFIASIWIMLREKSDESISPCLDKLHSLAISSMNIVFCFILIVQLLCTIYPIYRDIKSPFSNGMKTAQWIKQSGLDDWVIAGYPNGPLTTVVGFLDKPLYELVFDKFLWFPSQGKFSNAVPVQDVIVKVPRLRETYGSRILFIFNKPLSKESLHRYELSEMARFTGAIIPHEDFYVYALKGAIEP